MNARAACALALFFTFASAPSFADDGTSLGRSRGPCIGSFTPPAALAIFRDQPIAFGHANVVDVFSAGVSGPDYAIEKFCHVVTDVVAATVTPDATFYVAEPRAIHRVRVLNDGSTWMPETIVPPLGTRDRIEAIAVNAQEQIEVVVSTNGDPGSPRFLLYDRIATGAATPLRDFTSTDVSAAVSAVAFDARGELYAYDDDGEIVEFASNADGANPATLKKIAGAATLLRPAAAAPHGKRAVTVDRDGNITAADDRFVLTFAKDANGDSPPFDTLVSADRVYGLGTDSRGFLYVLRVNLQGDNPTTSVSVFEAAGDRGKSAIDAQPLREDVVAS